MTEVVADAREQVRRALDDAGVAVDGICRLAEAVLPALPDGIAAGLRAEVEQLRAGYAGAVRDIGAMLATAGDTDVLRTAGSAWVEGISAPVSRLVGVATDDVLETDDRWTGRAAEAYRATLMGQRTALTAVVAICTEVDTILGELASAILTFWSTLAAACIGMVLALAGIVTASATVVGVAFAVSCTAALLTAMDVALGEFHALMSTTAAKSAALERRLADDTAFPLGHWPRSTTGISPLPADWVPR